MAEIVLYHHIQGLTEGVTAFAEDLRDSGHTVHVPDMFEGRTFGVTIAQKLAQTRNDARGALLIDSCLPVSEIGSAWPAEVPVQIHGMEDDEFFDEDLPSARASADSTPAAELFVYPGNQHLFTDSSLDSFDAGAAALVLERTRSLLSAL